MLEEKNAEEVLASCYSRVKALWTENKLSEAQKNVLRSQLDIRNPEVVHKLSLSHDGMIISLAGDLLFHQNVLANIDGGKGSTLHIVQSHAREVNCHSNSPEESYVMESACRPQSFRRFGTSEYHREVKSGHQERLHGIRAFTAHGYVNSLRTHSKNKLDEYLQQKYPVPMESRARQYRPLMSPNYATRPGLTSDPDTARPSIDTAGNLDTRYLRKGDIDFTGLSVGDDADFNFEEAADCPGTPSGRFQSRSQSFAHGAVENKEHILIPVEDMVPQLEVGVNGVQGSVSSQPAEGCSEVDSDHNSVDMERESTASTKPFPVLWQIYSRGGFEDLGDSLLQSFLLSHECQRKCDGLEEGAVHCSLTRDYEKVVSRRYKDSDSNDSVALLDQGITHVDNIACENSVQNLIGKFNRLSRKVESSQGGTVRSVPSQQQGASTCRGDLYISDDIDAWEKKVAHQRSATLPTEVLPTLASLRSDNVVIQNSGDRSALSKLFGNVAALRLKKSYSPFFVNTPHKVLSSNRTKKTVKIKKQDKTVHFGCVDILFLETTIGQGIPSDGGPSIGLDWKSGGSSSLRFQLDVFEEFRGGIVPDDVDDDEEWNDDWRLPREYFIDGGGHLSVEDRTKILRECGHRRCSIDLSSFMCRLDMASRMKNGRSRAPRMLIEGVDPDDVMRLQVELEARQLIEPYILQLVQKRRRSKQHV